MKFTKMHGIGNDYVYVDGFAETVTDPAALARVMADRHFGIGGDGLILILPPENGVEADVRMRMFNADGSESEMCGNGVRCVAKYAIDHALSSAKPLRVQTGRGVLPIDYTLEHGKLALAQVDMGEPILTPAQVPVDPSKMIATDEPHTFTLDIDGQTLSGTMVSMGNPHAVFYVENLSDQHLTLGPKLEIHPAFPNRINVHFVQVHHPGEVTVTHWERGSGPTLACGTGACAVCVAGVLTGRTERSITAHLPGGDLKLEWCAQNQHVQMTGPASEVFSGEWPI